MAKSKPKTSAKRKPVRAKSTRGAKTAKSPKSAKRAVRKPDAQPATRPSSPSLAASTFIRGMNIQGS